MKRKNDIILTIAVLWISAISMILINISRNKSSSNSEKEIVVMSVDGKVEREIVLSKDGDYGIVDDNGAYNIINIKDGVAKMKDANCPDKLCMHQGHISKNGESIVCLPHGLIVEIKSKKNPEVDIIR